MPRTARIAPGGFVYHVMNRGNARGIVFGDEHDYQAFREIMRETQHRLQMRLLAYCLMPNHWHMVLWPREEGELAAFIHRLTVTYVRRWHLQRDSVGTGHLYQGTYKSFPVQRDDHLFTVLRYVERNPLRANLVKRAQDWCWSSLWQRGHPRFADQHPDLAPWPIGCPRDWVTRVNRPQTAKELDALRKATVRGQPFGASRWRLRTAKRLRLESTLRPIGRPRKQAVLV